MWLQSLVRKEIVCNECITTITPCATWSGGRIVSLCRVVVATATGETVLAIGDTDAPVFPRSAIKPMQAIPLVASGAAETFGLTDAEIALACGSHVGSPLHVATAQSILKKIDLSCDALGCGVHWPLDSGETRALAASGEEPTDLHNNCSGKHCGFLAVGACRGLDVTGYTNASHPIMREVTDAISLLTGTTLNEAEACVDGCAIPAFQCPLFQLPQVLLVLVLEKACRLCSGVQLHAFGQLSCKTQPCFLERGGLTPA